MQFIRQHAHALISGGNDSSIVAQEKHFEYIVKIWYQDKYITKHIATLIKKYHGEKLNAIYDMKIVVVGDNGMGKSTLISTYCSNGLIFNEFFTSTGHYYAKKITIDEFIVNLSLWCCNGNQWEHAVHYTDVHVFILCYSVDSIDINDNITSKWISKLRDKNNEDLDENIPILLCGTKIDLRHKFKNDQNVICVDKLFGQQLAESIGAVMYVECCSLNSIQKGVDHVFGQSTVAALKYMGKLVRTHNNNQSNCNNCSIL